MGYMIRSTPIPPPFIGSQDIVKCKEQFCNNTFRKWTVNLKKTFRHWELSKPSGYCSEECEAWDRELSR